MPTVEEKLSEHGERIAAVERILPTLATKADLLDLKAEILREMNAQTWRLITVGSAVFTTVSTALVTVTYFIARNVH